MVNIVTVENNRDLKKFVKFVNDLYKDNEYFVPDLVFDEVNTLRKDKNPAYEFSDAEFFLAYRGKEIVGRIGVMVNHKCNEKWKQNQARFTHFDFIDDYEVSSTLMETAISWARERGYEKLHGPMGLTDFDHQGMMTEGFEEQDMFITIYNAPYYVDHMKKMGFGKDVGWVEYKIDIPDKPLENISRIAEIVKRRKGFKLVEFSKKKGILDWAPQIFKLYNEAYAPLYGTTLLSDEQVQMYIDSFFGFVNPHFIKLILNAEDEMIGFGLTFPSLSKAMKKAGGKLFPFGFMHILRSIKKNDTLDLYVVAIKPEYQGSGAAALLIDSIMKSAIAHGMTIGETGPELEDNRAVQTMWKHFNTRVHRRRQIFIKDI